jgi:hypothetical protein
MLDTLLGGFLAILGGIVATWYSAKNTRKSRMEEVIVERKVSANAEAYSSVKDIQSHFTQSSATQTLALIHQHENWFFNNRLFLPGEFPAKWLSVRNDLQIYCRLEVTPSTPTEDIVALAIRIRATLTGAVEEIYRDMNLTRITLDDHHV